ncbi:PLD nuclease N-terminal domain-containing protein [Pseudomonas sp. W2Oct36]|uniref:PLD nuclease N-terminal domain-containing protein n=1 Tax=unclassified Pseudomonas TaxID=196821 RepID=UPI0017822EBC|nr:PLD nuclease N-terminal domain-containing protein [Pseudomonas sp. CFBP 8772]MBD8596393.1 PLDc_N domain-containing protein [Pseudomonas sp. CFBP 8772]
MDTVFSAALVVFILLIDVWAIASVWRGPESPWTKIGWVVLIFIFPVVGVAIWGIAGPRGIAKSPTSRVRRRG